MRLIIVSSDSQLANEHTILHQLFAAGMSCFHLRKPNWSRETTADFLNAINSNYHNRIVLHDHHELSGQFELKGIHYNTRNKPEDSISIIPELTLSASLHSLEDIEKFTSIPLGYAFLSPIFNSISKPSYKTHITKTHITYCLKKYPHTIALGGINADNIQTCHQMGFTGVAVLGAVWLAPDPLQVFKQLTTLCQSYE